MLPVYAIAAASALVIAIPEWRITGMIIFFVSFLNILFLNDLESFMGIHDGAFWTAHDFIVALILFFASGRQTIPLLMSGLLAIFCIFHALLEISVVLEEYSFFWREYVNIILTLNLLQLSFLGWGLWSGVKSYFSNVYARANWMGILRSGLSRRRSHLNNTNYTNDLGSKR